MTGRVQTVFVALMFAAFIAGFVTGARLGEHHASPRSCAFDGGGTLASGDAARTTDGQVWACADGQLYRLPSHFPAGRSNY